MGDWPGRGLGLMICSSNEGAGLTGPTSGTWKPGDRASITKRLGGGGAGRLSGQAKGRVLFALQYRMIPSRWEPVGALLFHVPPRKSKPLVVKRVCVEQSLSTRDKHAATVLLIRAAKKVAAISGRGAGRLQWEVDPNDARTLCDLYSFKRRGNRRQQALLESD